MGNKTFAEVQNFLQGKVILVANRGIPARRICRSIREGFDAVAAMTAADVDKTAPAASTAQELLLLGPEPRSYLDIDKIITKARQRGVVGIHPGWGFASEDTRFPQRCKEAGITFIGATAEAMNLLGNKVQAREVARRLRIPVVPGSDGAVDIADTRQLIDEIGLPIMLKAEGGGGGRGIFTIYNQAELEDAFFKASMMAQASFGNPHLFLEKFLDNVRHIEIQIIADMYGNVFAFDERDCTVQRNHQKLIEITPSPWLGMTRDLRERLKDYARRLIRAVGYYSLATVEFLITPDGSPYLIEVNTRLQVEHGITECRYGIDLVEEQIAVAFGAELRYREESLRASYCSMQVRINCENPQNNFEPNSGLITRYVSPGGLGVRLDSNISAGYEFPANYDSAGALLITYAHDWEKTLGIMDRALSEYIIGGIKTTIPFFRQVLKNPFFRKGDINTYFIANHPELMLYTDLAPEGERLARLVAEISAKGYNPYLQLGAYRSATTPALGPFEPVLPPISSSVQSKPSPYPQGDRLATLDFIRDSGWIHFSDTTPRDFTQSNSGNRFRLAEDKLLGPYLDNVGYFSIENGGGAHFHVSMLANMTYPFSEANEWNNFAPKTFKQLLVRSTNVLGYTPQPRNLMHKTGEMICDCYQVVRCFDFLNHIENMRPIAEVVLSRKDVIFQPALSMSWAKGFDVSHYLDVTESILRMTSDIMGVSSKTVSRSIILGLKDMGGVCPPRFMTELVEALRKRWPELVLHYHRHYTDGLFVPACGAAAKAGAHILDVGLGAAVRSYGQGDVLSTMAYLEDELSLTCRLNKNAIRDANFVCKQIMPYYDRYCSPYFQGIDYDVTLHGMPGGATSSSQEGVMKQGYIHLLPYMLKFLEGTRRIVRYHDVTPGSQITWNTAFLAVTGAWKRGGEEEVRYLLEVLNEATRTPQTELSSEMRKARLIVYQDCNDAFRNLLLGKFGKLPLGFPADWVYKSAFGAEWKTAVAKRTEASPLETLQNINMDLEEQTCTDILKRKPNAEEFILYLNHPADALKAIQFKAQYGDSNNLPLHVWFEGLKIGQDLYFNETKGKPHHLVLLSISRPSEMGVSVCRYVLDSEIMSYEVKVSQPTGPRVKGVAMADPTNRYHIAAPSNGDLWVMYVHPGDIVKAGEEVFNVSIMKQEKAVLASVDGIVKRVLKTADFKGNKQMISVCEGELIVELAPVPRLCSHPSCGQPIPPDNAAFCPHCGSRVE
ncbi:pyruvate carboxylase [Candidatus Desulfovibrio trichonymphae]|uniref:pyruvate carboxylase n=1 Tax=Candidatus Desulfovibrio trichonymphae TaxID=1725232 RepID=A0A1J1DPW2_9BACT|nr:pyruvate carboxylase [Candidatus Desulfovibrio trichonymphae]BAV91881.1 pyruvate carboxylase [Candidatus Desulfovibrio trichonymphae]